MGNGVQTGEAAGPSIAELARRFITIRTVSFVLLVLLLVFVARSCQSSQVRVSQARAIDIARQRVDFQPKQTQIRLLRQGLNAHPYWAVSLSIPQGGGYRKLTVVRVDANTGSVAAVDDQRPTTTTTTTTP